jgi:UDP-glucose 4-epimerase
MSVLVTGVAGFIGAAVAKALISEGVSVVGVDNLSTGHVDNVPTNAKFIKGDVHDEKIIEHLGEYDFDTIFHIAGQSSGEVSFAEPVYDLQTNCQSTLMLLDFARRKDCRNFIFASSMSVYGNPVFPERPVTEEQRLSPLSLYAVGKIASENYLDIYARHYGLSCVSLRLFNVYGPGQNMQNLKQGMVSIYLAQALSSASIVVKGSRNRFRDQVFIDDVVEAFVATKRAMKPGFVTYNIATGVKTTVAEIVSAIKEYVPKVSSVDYVEGTLGDQYGIFGDSFKARSGIGWEATVDFRSGLKKMIEWAGSDRGLLYER